MPLLPFTFYLPTAPSKKYNITFSKNDIAEICQSTIVGKPHIVNFVAQKFGLDKETLYKDLRKCYVGDARQEATTVIKAIKESDGISVWAHPLGGEGEPLLSNEEFKSRLRVLCRLGVQGLECYYSRYTNEQEAFLVHFAQENNLLISGGSDYHGANKPNISLGKLCSEDRQVKISQLTILRNLVENNVNIPSELPTLEFMNHAGTSSLKP